MKVLPGSTCGNPASAPAIATPEYAYFATVLTLLCTLCNCCKFTASVGFTPAATFVIVRSLPGEPTDTEFDWLATDPAPSATEFAPLATAFEPIAVDCVPVACDWKPTADEP
ncbi:hypothetical protein SAMN05192543_104305 [Paraburkholderia megapolitana]|uniref:Uncharacterized protein n=1 Tax=Paraburkholderia megapolitana TaxID=420953 RepID=A0A1I3L9E2_9BURK|nr:hypothetical protein SAMN05192543_104305 [Paraburkholderia megapolitana]